MSFGDEKKSVRLVHPTARQTARTYVDVAPDGWEVTFSPPKKKRIQEEKYHAMLGDIARQCLHFGRQLTLLQWKRVMAEAFVHVLREEARAKGDPDPFPEGQILPSIDGLRVVQVDVLTRDFTVKQAAAFIEYLYAYGAENGVRWSDPLLAREYADAQL